MYIYIYIYIYIIVCLFGIIAFITLRWNPGPSERTRRDGAAVATLGRGARRAGRSYEKDKRACEIPRLFISTSKCAKEKKK